MSGRWSTDERAARVALSRLAEPGSKGLGAAVAARGAVDTLGRLLRGADTIRGVVPEHFSEDRVAEDLSHTEQLGARVLIPADPDWPAALDDLGVPPLCLWVRGSVDLNTVGSRSVAIVGARSATAYGTHVSGDLAAGLSERGFAVVSGAAFGIDAAAHRGCLAVDGITVAVLAGGIDRLYPVAHSQLLGTIADTGAVITEQPPGVAPLGSRFLSRNRIIAALGCGTVVVEASLRSGSLNTVGHALAIPRPVGAVPGPVTSMQSAGCHELVRNEDVRLVTDAAEVAELVGRIGADLAEPKRGARSELDDLDPEDRALFEALPMRRFARIEDLARSVSASVMAVRAGLGRLELSGAAQRDDVDRWRKAPRRPATSSRGPRAQGRASGTPVEAGDTLWP